MQIRPFSLLRVFTQIVTTSYDIGDVATGGVTADELREVLKKTVDSLSDNKLRLDEVATVVCVLLLFVKEEANRETRNT